MKIRQPETERNAKLIKFYNTGSYSYSSLARMFKITRQRVHSIVKRDREENIDFENKGVPTLMESQEEQK